MSKTTASRLLRITALVLCLFMALSVCLACKSPAGENSQSQTADGSAQSSAPGQSAPDTGFIEAESFKLIENGKACSKVIRPDDAKDSDISITTAVKIKKMLQELLDGSSQPIGTDWTVSGEHDPEAIEILVGPTTYSEGSDETASLGLGTYMLKAFGNKIIVYSRSAAGYEKAFERLTELVRANLKQEGSVNSLDIPRGELSVIGVYNEGLTKLPETPAGAELTAVYDSGEECEEVIYSGVTKESFGLYTSAIISSNQFTPSGSDVEIAGNIFRRYKNDSEMLVVGYYPGKSEIRVVVEPFSQTSINMQEANRPFTSVTDCGLTMLGVSYVNSAGETKNNGLATLIRLKDGRFIIVDGGFNTEAHAQSLIKAIKDQYSAYASSGSPTIAAWIVTHAHGDHEGVLNGRNTLISEAGIKVETVMVNYLSQYELERSRALFPSNWDATEGDGYVNTYKAAQNLGAELILMHTGQKFYFPGLNVEILYTIENMAPNAINAMNSTSIIARMEFEGTNPTVYMCTGDATGGAFAITSSNYGDYLKCDIVQVSHHGGSTWGNDAGTAAAYKIMKPSVVLWPAGIAGYEGKKSRSYNIVLLQKDTNPNFSELYVAGALGARTELIMPYTAGTAKTTQP